MKSLFLLIFTLSILIFNVNYISAQDISSRKGKSVIIDCNYTLKEALANKKIPVHIKRDLRLINVYYFSFDGRLHEGQLIINKSLVSDIKSIFKIIERTKFPIARVIPIVKYNWSDDSSVKNNNTSAFNYRYVKGTHRLSYHAFGRAIDINPWLNPQIIKNKSLPKGEVYNPRMPGTITRGSIIVKAFLRRGWIWGGNWRSTKDYQHFEKHSTKR